VTESLGHVLGREKLRVPKNNWQAIGKAGDSDARAAPRLPPGDERAFAEFYHDWFPTVMAWAKETSHRDEAFCLDVVQDAMIRLIRYKPSLDSHGAFVAWLRAAVRSSAIDLMRREIAASVRERASATPEARAPTSVDDRTRELLAALTRLTPDDQMLLRLRSESEVTYEALSLAFDSTPDSLYGRARRAISKLRSHIVRERSDDEPRPI
jgi:RNA polymerase sigma factor (sigma-70 family)